MGAESCPSGLLGSDLNSRHTYELYHLSFAPSPFLARLTTSVSSMLGFDPSPYLSNASRISFGNSGSSSVSGQSSFWQVGISDILMLEVLLKMGRIE